MDGNYAYSLEDVVAALSGPGGNIPLTGDEAGGAKEGVSIARTGDANVMLTGGDGSWSHSLQGDKSGTVTITLLKTSTINQALQNLFDYQRASSRNWGRNTIVITDKARGDVITCLGCAFVKDPDTKYATEAGTNEWVFHCGRIDKKLGA